MTVPLYNLTDTWANGATVFTAIKMNVTDSASDVTSLLIDLQVAGLSKFSVKKDGTVIAGGHSPLLADVADQALSGGALVTVFDNGTKSSGTFTPDCGNCPLQKCVNGGAFTLAAPAADSSCMLMVTNNGSAGAITFSGFSVGANTGDALTTTNTNVFTISIWRMNGVSGYRIAAHQ